MDKLIPSVEAGALFGVLSLPMTYKFTDSVAEKAGLELADADYCPTTVGVVAHAIVYTLLAKVLMMYEANMRAMAGANQWTEALMGGALFVVLGHPMTYKFTNGLLGSIIRTSNMDGCPTNAGVLVHSALFAGVSYLKMAYAY